MKLGFTAAAVVGLAMTSVSLMAQTNSIPDSPRPQTLPNASSIAPGIGAPAGISTTPPEAPGEAAPTSTLSTNPATPPDPTGEAAPDITPELGPGGRVQTLRANVNFVQIPFTVKDKSGALVPALSWRDVRIMENGIRKHISLFSSDPYPLSVAFVIDQSLPFEVMKSVNTALGALQGAFTPYDEMAIFTYNNGPRLRTDYTSATGARISAVIEQSKSTGREAQLYTPDGPLSQTTMLNGKQVDPNTAPNRGCAACTFQAPPKETHTLNDAIAMAAQSLARRPDNRRRIIYVVSDGKELGSTAKFKDNIRFLQTNKISVYATVVGDSSTPYIGFLDHYHIPLTMRENILPQYASATGGEAISEFRTKGMEQSFAKLAEDVRVQYTVGYYSNEPITDGKFRSVEVQVMRNGLDVIAKKGYYPTPENAMRAGGGTGTPAGTGAAAGTGTPAGTATPAAAQPRQATPMPFHLEANAALGLLAALLWGGGDFAGSVAVKRAGGTIRAALLVILIGHTLSLAVIASLAITRGNAFPNGAPLLWGIGGGAVAGISLIAFYMALAQGHMGSAAAVSGLLCAAVPAVVSGFTEGAPNSRKLLGFLLAGAAIWLIASAANQHAPASRSAITLATLSGIGFGIYFVALKYAGEAGLLWPMALSRIGSLSAAAVILIAMSLSPARQPSPTIKPHPWQLLACIATGAALDSGGNLSFLAATRIGRLDVAAVLASIYPASTILLAAFLLHERTTPQQRWGMALALPAVVLITL